MSKPGFIEGQPVFWMTRQRKDCVELWACVEVGGLICSIGRYITREALRSIHRPDLVVRFSIRQMEDAIRKKVSAS